MLASFPVENPGGMDAPTLIWRIFVEMCRFLWASGFIWMFLVLLVIAGIMGYLRRRWG